MQLIGYLDFPFLRRVAFTMKVLGIEYQHRELSIFRDFEAFRAINPMAKVAALQFIGTALVAIEKVAQLVYETSQRPEELQYEPWMERLEQQLEGAAGLMESTVSDHAGTVGQWLLGDNLTQADISTAVAWRFMMYTARVHLNPNDYPALVAFSRRAEALPEFMACPLTG